MMNTDLLVKVKNRIKARSNYFIGYPAGIDFDYGALNEFWGYHLNNVGDPFTESNDMQTKAIEREVVQFFADLFNAPKNNWWGYVTNGGSEGNLYALYVAREVYPTAMVYYSEATHYSVQKNIHLLGMQSIVVRSQENGELDYDDLKETIQLYRHLPAIIIANIGTTMTEAKDDIVKIRSILQSLAFKSYHIHSDAALSGVYLGLMKKGNFDFDAGADSIAISGHKFIGSPIMCGIVIVKKNLKERIGRAIPYIGTTDTTISGSRNGITPLFLWYTIEKLGKEGLLKRALECLSLAEYTEQEINKSGIKAWRNPYSITVVFQKPPKWICSKWQLATENEIAHLICMPGIKKDQIDEFVIDLANQHKHVGDEALPEEYNLN